MFHYVLGWIGEVFGRRVARHPLQAACQKAVSDRVAISAVPSQATCCNAARAETGNPRLCCRQFGIFILDKNSFKWDKRPVEKSAMQRLLRT
jgi:hypothetical protein